MKFRIVSQPSRATLPPLVLGATAVGIIVVLATSRPPWALMDDATNLGLAADWWESGRPLAGVWDRSLADLAAGRFRPVYFVWVATVYHFFAGSPLLAYLATALINFGAMLLWGAAFVALLQPTPRWEAGVRFLLPAAFLLFPPHWNNFLWVSLQEKFVILFGGLALLAFARSEVVQAGHRWVFVGAVGFALGFFSKETALAIPAAVVALLSLRLLGGNRASRADRLWLMIGAAMTVAMSAFVVTVLLRGSYTSRYSDGLGPSALVEGLAGLPRFVVVILLLSIGAMAASVVRGPDGRWRPRRRAVLPLVLLLYTAMLLPWGYPTYLLSGMTPFVIGSLAVLGERISPLLARRISPARTSILPSVAVTLLVAMMLILDSFPKMQWQRDMGEAKAFLSGDAIGAGTFLFPPPFSEHAGTLAVFTEREIEYLSNRAIRVEDSDSGPTYLISYLDHTPVMLEGVRLGEPVFANRTWTVRRVMAGSDADAEQHKEEFLQASSPIGRRLRLLIG